MNGWLDGCVNRWTDDVDGRIIGWMEDSRR